MNNFLLLHRKHFHFEKFVREALREDAGSGDYTSLSTIPARQRNTMKLISKEEGVIAGVEAAIAMLKLVDRSVRINKRRDDGAAIKKSDLIFEATGNTRKLLLAERLMLNVMQRMSGIATKTRALQALCEGTKARVTDTRKTTPGFRFFEKWAVHIGGGVNHRFGLYDMILIKDNHIDFAGGIENALSLAHNFVVRNHLRIPIEVETRTIGDVEKALARGGIHRIMLDNFSVADTRRAVRLINGVVEVESSGGITEKNVRQYARTGVDFISAGALTHHVNSLDLSFKAV